MKIGFTFKNQDMTLTVVAFYGTKNFNLALLVSEKGSGGCHYVTVRDLTRESNDNYFWYYGHYTNDFDEAIKDLYERRKNLGL